MPAARGRRGRRCSRARAGEAHASHGMRHRDAQNRVHDAPCLLTARHSGELGPAHSAQKVQSSKLHGPPTLQTTCPRSSGCAWSIALLAANVCVRTSPSLAVHSNHSPMAMDDGTPVSSTLLGPGISSMPAQAWPWGLERSTSCPPAPRTRARPSGGTSTTEEAALPAIPKGTGAAPPVTPPRSRSHTCADAGAGASRPLSCRELARQRSAAAARATRRIITRGPAARCARGPRRSAGATARRPGSPGCDEAPAPTSSAFSCPSAGRFGLCKTLWRRGIRVPMGCITTPRAAAPGQ